MSIKKHELTPEQELHNAMVEMDIKQAEREFQERERDADKKGSFNMIGRRTIIAMIYV